MTCVKTPKSLSTSLEGYILQGTTKYCAKTKKPWKFTIFRVIFAWCTQITAPPVAKCLNFSCFRKNWITALSYFDPIEIGWTFEESLRGQKRGRIYLCKIQEHTECQYNVSVHFLRTNIKLGLQIHKKRKSDREKGWGYVTVRNQREKGKGSCVSRCKQNQKNERET